MSETKRGLLALAAAAVLLTGAAEADAQETHQQYLPIVTSGDRLPLSDAGDTDLYLGFVEILDHCVVWDELLDCVEFDHASKLDRQECGWAQAQAHALCIVIGAPVEKGIAIP